MRPLILVLLGVLVTAGCGSTVSGTSESSTSAGPTSSGTTSTPDTDGRTVSHTQLTIVLTGAGTTATWHLTCDPPGGDHPTPDQACAALRDHGAQALPPVPTDRLCAQVHRGDNTARVHGTWRGSTVDATFSLTDSCQIARWELLDGLLPRIPG
jgi:uncharacterized protein YceK